MHKKSGMNSFVVYNNAIPYSLDYSEFDLQGWERVSAYFISGPPWTVRLLAHHKADANTNIHSHQF